MGIFSSVAALFRSTTNVLRVYEPVHVAAVLGQSPAELYATQPHLRTVVSFRARNVAQLGLQVFERASDTDRRRVTESPAALLLRRPNPDQTLYELLERLVSDLDLYDAAYWLVLEDASAPSGWVIRPVLASSVVSVKSSSAFWVDAYVIADEVSGRTVEVPASQMLVFHGYSPESLTAGVSPIRALKEILAEQVQAWSFRRQMWERGGRVGTYLSRPADAPSWDDDARERFKNDWREYEGRGGSRAGSTPLLEDGIDLKQSSFSAKEQEWSETTKLSLQTVASVYHVNPVMVGILDNANYSNTKEFRKALYSETLGPLLRMIQDRLTQFLLPMVDPELVSRNGYVEFNVEAQLVGDLAEEASVLSTSAGAPWMTVNEVRARKNLPGLEGGDQLVVPLNVTQGGQSSPQDGGEPLPAVTGGSQPVFDADDLLKRVNAAAALIRSGFAPEAALAAAGLDPVEHLGLLPVTVQKPQAEESADEDLVDDLTGKAVVASWMLRCSRSVESKRAAGVEVDWARWERELQADLVVKAGVDQFNAGVLAKQASAVLREAVEG